MAIKSEEGPLEGQEFNDEELYVYSNEGKGICKINRKLLDKMDAWNNLNLIKEAHRLKYSAYELLKKIEDPDELKEIDKLISQIEFNLQEFWGFPQNAKYHRFWERPKCTCPKMDNAERWPIGYYVISGDCPLHGGGEVLSTRPQDKKTILEKMRKIFK